MGKCGECGQELPEPTLGELAERVRLLQARVAELERQPRWVWVGTSWYPYAGAYVVPSTYETTWVQGTANTQAGGMTNP